MSIIVEELAAKLGLEIDGAAFKVAEEMLAVAHGGLVALGAAAVAAAGGLAVAVAMTARHAEAVEKAAQRTGIGVESLQALEYAAERAQVGSEGLQSALNFMAKRGVKDFEAELRRAADELQRMPDGGAKAARAMQLFGKHGAALIPMLNKGAEGLDEMTAFAREAGIVLSKDMVEAAAETNDAIEEMQAFLKGLAYTIAGPLMKPVTEWLRAAGRWIAANRAIIAQHVERTLTLIGNGLGYVLRLIEPVVDIAWRLEAALMDSKAALLALGAVGLWLAAPFLAPVAAIGALLMALEEVWGWVTGKRSTLLEDAFGSFSDLKKSLDVAISPDDSNVVAIAKRAAQWLEKAVALARELRGALGLGESPVDREVADLSSPDRFVREKAVASLKGRGMATWQGRDVESYGPIPGGVPNVQYGAEVTAPRVYPGLGGAAGSQTTIGSITVQAPPGSTAQDVVNLIKEQIGIAQRTEYITALPAVAGP